MRTDARLRRLGLLAAAALLLVGLAVFALHRETSEGARAYQPTEFLPGLAAHLGEVARIHFASKNGAFDVDFTPERGWTLPGHDDYPASYDEVHRTLVGLAALQTLEPKTARKDWLHFLGLDAPPQGGGTAITLYDDKGHVMADVITGNTEDIGDPSGETGLYVRKANSTQSYLASAVYVPHGDAAAWLDKNVLDIDPARIAEVDVDPASGPSYELRRAIPTDSDFSLSPVPRGHEADPAALGGVADAVTGFAFDDVAPARDFDFSQASRLVTKCFDGLMILTGTIQKDGATWVVISARPLPGSMTHMEAVQKEAGAIDARAAGWAYRLSADKAAQFTTPLESLLMPKPQPGKPAP
ncbi:MAG TPA: DUF4340 domain-containing protein [Rhizomicrobium sp.]